MKKKNLYNKIGLIMGAFVLGFTIVVNAGRLPLVGKFFTADVNAVYDRDEVGAMTVDVVAATVQYVPTHQMRPEAVKGIYVSSWVAGTPSIMSRLIGLVDRTEINAVVLDIKDDTGLISFEVIDPELKNRGTDSKRIPDIEGLIKTLHEKGIYVIGRISTFQDPLFTKKHPELAVVRKSDGKTWRDRKGLSWLDPGARPTWEYLLSIAEESYARGFDEINFDYIRFPTDGDMKNIVYRFYDAKTMTKPAQMKLFYEYLHKKLSTQDCSLVPEGGSPVCASRIPHSADLFGMTTTAEDDMGIGQIFSDALPYFDFIMPMVYPSHYGAGINGYKNPAAHPYEMVEYAIKGAMDKASTTQQDIQKIRPWLQDFDLATDYDAKMVRQQIKAVNDAGLTSWLLWDAANKYTEAALLPN